MRDKIFIDTNILVYASVIDNSNSQKRIKALEFISQIESKIIISTQVINEFYVSLLKNKVSENEIQKKIMELLIKTEVSTITMKTILEGWELRKKYNLSYWDSLIISSALENECTILYSEDLQNNMKIKNKLVIRNPLIN